MAARNGHLEVVELLLGMGVDANKAKEVIPARQATGVLEIRNSRSYRNATRFRISQGGGAHAPGRALQGLPKDVATLGGPGGTMKR